MQVFDIVAGILYLVVAAIEAFVILVAALASSFHPVFTILAHDVNSKASLWHDCSLWQSPLGLSLI